MKKIILKQEYIQIKDNGQLSYGGSQNWFVRGKLADYGCGLVAAGDILLYLFGEKKRWEKEEYLRYLKSLNRSFFYVPFLTCGIPGPLLSVGFNLKAFFHKMNFHAAWTVPVDKVHRAIHLMLEKDIPVLFSVGVNFPWVWKKDGVPLYQVTSLSGEEYREGMQLVNCGSVSRHYMIITGVYFDKENGELLRISSWGKQYYIKWKDYEEFMRHKSNGLFTNILYITEKDCQ